MHRSFLNNPRVDCKSSTKVWRTLWLVGPMLSPVIVGSKCTPHLAHGKQKNDWRGPYTCEPHACMQTLPGTHHSASARHRSATFPPAMSRIGAVRWPAYLGAPPTHDCRNLPCVRGRDTSTLAMPMCAQPCRATVATPKWSKSNLSLCESRLSWQTQNLRTREQAVVLPSWRERLAVAMRHSETIEVHLAHACEDIERLGPGLKF